MITEDDIYEKLIDLDLLTNADIIKDGSGNVRIKGRDIGNKARGFSKDGIKSYLDGKVTSQKGAKTTLTRQGKRAIKYHVGNEIFVIGISASDEEALASAILFMIEEERKRVSIVTRATRRVVTSVKRAYRRVAGYS